MKLSDVGKQCPFNVRKRSNDNSLKPALILRETSGDGIEALRSA